MQTRVRASILLAATLTLAISIGTRPGFAQQEIYLGIHTTGAQRIRLVVEEFECAADQLSVRLMAHQASEILRNDLDTSGLIETTGATVVKQEMGVNTLAPAHLKSRFDASTQGRLAIEGNDIVIEARLYDVPSEKMVASFRRRVADSAFRSAIHQMADHFLHTLTGETGIAETKIVMVREMEGRTDICAMDYDGHNLKVLVQNAALNLLPAWSPRGDEVAYTSYIGDQPGLYVLSLETGVRKRLSTLGGLNTSAAWSPDGEKLAYSATRGTDPEIFAIHRSGSSQERLTFHPAIDCSPTWAPNGHEIAFTSDRSGTPQIYLMSSDGTNVRRLTYEGNYNDSPSWSPAGDRVAFSGRVGGRFRICIIATQGGPVYVLTNDPGNHESPSWAPDGRHIVYVSTQSGRSAVYVINADGTNNRRISSSSHELFAPSWSPPLSPRLVAKLSEG
ncbi:MAG: Tol-Pal system beta propeller repeat protein TolB [Candidatus Eisenbacteria sp.]|nr:Tol-Pal system beta propeller repeat protein TolB [Candidatus Eisenbacteria bacterium]